MRSALHRALIRAAGVAAAPHAVAWPPPFFAPAMSRHTSPHAAAPPAAARRSCSSSATGAHVCWSCGVARGAGDLYFCGSCHNILPADAGHDYFALLGCARAFDLSQPQLELAFKEAQRTLHPDKFCTRPEVEQRHSAAQAARLNTAYAVLRAPLSRARYLLHLLGYARGDDGEAARRPADDPELLAEVLESRERAAQASGDARALRAMLHAARAQLKDAEGSLRLHFAKGDLAAATSLAARLAYLTSLAEHLAEAQHAAEAAEHATHSG